MVSVVVLLFACRAFEHELPIDLLANDRNGRRVALWCKYLAAHAETRLGGMKSDIEGFANDFLKPPQKISTKAPANCGEGRSVGFLRFPVKALIPPYFESYEIMRLSPQG